MGRQACAQEVANSEWVWTTAANLGKLAIEQRVRVEIAGGAERAFHDFAVEIGDDKVGGRQRCVVDTAGFDDDQRLGTGAVDAAGVAEGVRGEAAAGDLLIGVEDLLAKGFEKHVLFLTGWKAFTK